MKQINWGLIGTGDVMEIKSGPGLYKAKQSCLYGVYNRTLEKAVNYARRHGVENVFHSAEELICCDHINVVYIATPPVSHKEYALQVLRAGKIPYIEKPVAMNYSEVLEINALADSLNLPVYVAFYRRGLEKFIKIKHLLNENVIGNIRYVNVTQTAPITPDLSDRANLPWRVLPHISGGGLFMDIGSHVLDSLMMFFGEFEAMQGYATNTAGYYPAEDTVVTAFTFKNGVIGTGNWCFVADEFKNEVEIVGDKGKLVYDGLSAKHFELTVEGKTKHFDYIPPEHIAMPYQEAIINELLGKSTSHANFDHAVNLMSMMDKILQTYYD